MVHHEQNPLGGQNIETFVSASGMNVYQRRGEMAFYEGTSRDDHPYGTHCLLAPNFHVGYDWAANKNTDELSKLPSVRKMKGTT